MEHLNLDSAAFERPWDWLIDAARRLDVAVEVVGPNLEPMLPVGSDRAAITLRKLLTTDDVFRAAIATAVAAPAPESATAGGFQTICYGLVPERALIVGREVTDAGTSDDRRRDLEAIGRWLVPVVRATLTQSSHAINVEAYRVASLRRILDEAAGRGTARTVIGAFIEALSVWDDVQVFGYAATIGGAFTRYASPRGAAAALAPAELDRADVPAIGRIERLSDDTVGRLHLRGDACDVLIGRIRTTDDLEWVQLFRGAVGSIRQVRLMVYLDLLREVLDKTLRATFERSAEAIDRRPPLRSGQPLDLAAQALAAHLMGSVDARQAALAMALTTGRQIFAVGSVDLLTPHAPDDLANRLIVTSPAADSLLTFAAAREAPAFTTFERRVAQAGLGAVHRWFDRAVRETNEYERRQRGRRVDALFEEIADGAIRAGEQVTVAVLSFGSDVPGPGTLHAAVAKIRDHIRSCDFAGILSATEIGVLLSGMPSVQCARLSARLQDLLTTSENGGAPVQPAVGVTTWTPERAGTGSIVATARAALQTISRVAPPSAA